MTGPFPSLQTARLIVRAPLETDIDALIERRNDPDVSRYQDWTLPYSREQGEELLKGAITQGGLIDGEWWMLTVVERGTERILGDLAVHVSWGGRAAEIGYSLHPWSWGKGYATEAVAVLLNHLFDDFGIRRASAMLHPDNIASAVVLERNGFLHEGRTKLSSWVGDGDDAENTDDLLYGLTSEDRAAWLARPTGSPGVVRLIEVTPENHRALLGLATHKSQERLVAPVAVSFADALFTGQVDGAPFVPFLRAIEADGALVGFLMVAMSTELRPEPYLWRLLIDRLHQRRGIAAMALDILEELLRDSGDKTLIVSWRDGRGSPEPFYIARGFAPTGERPHGAVRARKKL